MATLPDLGVGVSFRPAIGAGILQNLGAFDSLEVVADGHLRRPDSLDAIASLRPTVPHAVDLSVGSQVDPAYLEALRLLVRRLGAPWLGDHLAYTREGAVRIGHLAPVPYNDESLATVVANVRRVQAALGVPLALENITMPFHWPTDTMGEAEFITEALRKSGGLLLLDLENLRINAANHGYDAARRLGELPLDRVVQVHLAGGVTAAGIAHDTHSAPVPEATWDLYRTLCGLVRPAMVVLEHDHAFPPVGQLAAQVERARRIREGRHGA